MQPKEEYDMQVMKMDKIDKRAYMENLKLLPKADWTGFLNTTKT